MSENDTDPQRHPDPPEAYQRPGTNQPAGGLSRSAPAEGAALPAGDVPPAPPPTVPPPVTAVPPAASPPVPQPPVAGHPVPPPTGWSQPPVWAPAADQTVVQPPVWAPGYPGPYQQEQAGQWLGTPGYGVPPQQPQPPSGSPPADRGGRVARVAVTGLLALVLAGGGGVVGGLVVHAADSSSHPSSSSSSSVHSTAPIIDRSSLASIAAGVKDSVVSIQMPNAEGSGVILTADGYILTNNHVVAEAQGDTVHVLLSNGTSVTAGIVGTDPKTDLAVVKAQGVSGLQAAKFGDSNSLQVGDTVLAIGSPLGLDGSVTAGIISALNRTIQEDPQQSPNDPFGLPQRQQQAGTAIAGAIQTDAAINPGNSGGALVNTAGQVIGINTAIATADNSNSGNVGIGFAIPSNKAKTVADELIKGQKVSHPFIGVGVGDADNNAGATVASVVSGGPADKAGIKQGDIITKVDDTDIHNANDLVNAVQSAKVGDTLKLTVSRNGSTQEIDVTVGES